jgi:hypothetical protein
MGISSVKVYILTEGAYSDYRIVAVYATLEAAEAALIALAPVGGVVRDYGEVEEFEVL